MEETALQMTTGGWAFMAIAWTAIISLVVYCYWRVLKKDSSRSVKNSDNPGPE